MPEVRMRRIEVPGKLGRAPGNRECHAEGQYGIQTTSRAALQYEAIAVLESSLTEGCFLGRSIMSDLVR